VDGILVELKTIEEWGFNLGEYACLFEEDNESNTSNSYHNEVHQGEDVSDTVDLIVERGRRGGGGGCY